MNKTIDISLAGILFHLDETAYYKLKKYLKAVRHNIPQTDEVEEVMNEIEARIAELLMQKQQSPQQVINEKNIDEIIAVLGQPEDFEEEIQTETSYRAHTKKALFRDMDEAMIAGIASGLAHYVGLDKTLMRLLFILILFLSHGSFLLIYLLLWIIIPKAKTATDKLRMKGNQANLDNIVDQVVTDDTPSKKNKLGETIETTGSELGKIIVKIIGLIIVLVTGFLLISIVISALSISPFSDMSLLLNDNHILNSLHIPIGLISFLGFIIIGMPIALLFLLGFKLLFPNSNSLHKNVLIIGGTIWLLSVIYATVKTASVLSHKNTHSKVTTLATGWQKKNDTLLISSIKPMPVQNNFAQSNRIKIYFSPSTDSLIHIKITKIAEGVTKNKARENAKKIIFDYKIDSLHNRISFAEMINFPFDNLIGKHKVSVAIEVPGNMTVQLDHEMAQLAESDDCDMPLLLTNKDHEIHCLQQLASDEADVIKVNTESVQVKIGNNGVHINAKDNDHENAEIHIDQNGIKIKARDKKEKAEIQVNKNGVKVKQEDNH